MVALDAVEPAEEHEHLSCSRGPLRRTSTGADGPPVGRRGELDRDLAAILLVHEADQLLVRSDPAAARRTTRRAPGSPPRGGRTGRSARCRPARWRRNAGSARATAAARPPTRARASSRAPPSGCAIRPPRRPCSGRSRPGSCGRRGFSARLRRAAPIAAAAERVGGRGLARLVRGEKIVQPRPAATISAGCRQAIWPASD